mmetsp:Transcript_38758/g.116463  ORF Transcript_38758/g.116463 Transcript_38758/m.116463 type:complete len:83 (-) Transcript_38758:473-721(-)
MSKVLVHMHVMTARFGLLRTMNDFMDDKTWKSCAGYLLCITSVLGDGEEKYILGHFRIDKAANDMLVTQAAMWGKMMLAAVV